MPCISRFLGIKIYMYYDEHNPPHFHAIYNEFEALVDMQQISIHKGKLPPRVTGLVLERATLHQDELLHNRNIMEQFQEPESIDPLQ